MFDQMTDDQIKQLKRNADLVWSYELYDEGFCPRYTKAQYEAAKAVLEPVFGKICDTQQSIKIIVACDRELYDRDGESDAGLKAVMWMQDEYDYPE